MIYKDIEEKFLASIEGMDDEEKTKRFVDYGRWLFFEAVNAIDINDDMSNIRKQMERLEEIKEAIRRYHMMDKPNEQWKFLIGYEDKVELSTWGRLRSVVDYGKHKAGEIWRPTINNCWYLYGGPDNREIHRLVAETFRGECSEGCEVDHKNNVKIDDRIDNLRYVTRESNQIDAKKRRDKKTNTKGVKQYTLDGVFVAQYPSITDAVKANGWKDGIVGGITRACKSGINCKNFYWRYA